MKQAKINHIINNSIYEKLKYLRLLFFKNMTLE